MGMKKKIMRKLEELNRLKQKHQDLLYELSEYEEDPENNPDGYEIEDQLAIIEVFINELEYEIESFKK